MHWSRRCSLLICLALTLCTTAAAQISYPWISEDSSGRATVAQEDGDTLDIASPDGLTLWLDSCLRGTYTVSFRAQVLTGCDSCRLSDLNCFWAARDPEHPDDFFARSSWRQGWFDRYNTLCLFYVGFGGNENTTTRFRRYHGDRYGKDDPRVKPLLQEYTDPDHLLRPSHWHEVCIHVGHDSTTYSVDGRQLFAHELKPGEGDGYFALRLWRNHIRVAGFRVTKDY